MMLNCAELMHYKIDYSRRGSCRSLEQKFFGFSRLWAGARIGPSVF
jgi:hypothetical protein